MSKPHTCPTCKGGKHKTAVVCPTCEGTGVVWEQVDAEEARRGPVGEDQLDLTYDGPRKS